MCGGVLWVVFVQDILFEVLECLIVLWVDVVGLFMVVLQIMGILNVIFDSFSDGGKYIVFDVVLMQGCIMIVDGVMIIDVGGESMCFGVVFVF